MRLFFLAFCLSQVTEGVSLLLSVLRDPALQKSSKAWYLLRVQALQTLAFYLSLSSNLLSSALREQLWDQGERKGLLAFLDDGFLCWQLFVAICGQAYKAASLKSACIWQ